MEFSSNNFLNWKPDPEAMSFGEMIRHVWSSTFYYHMIIKTTVQ